MKKTISELFADAKKKGKLVFHEEEGIRYARFREDCGQVVRGTILILSKAQDPKLKTQYPMPKTRIIWGFSHIKRIFALEKGISRNIRSEYFYLEEKIDGFNLRVAKVNGNLFAFSRGGFIDWFSTEKIRGMGLERFFKDYPDVVLCGEMIGNTPYTAPAKGFDVKLFVFDIDQGDGAYLQPKEKYAILKKYGIFSVPVIGHFNKADVKKLKQAVLAIMKAEKEGIVLKSEDRADAVKYVTPYADIEDISRNMQFMFDMPSGFFIQRVLRSAFFMKDFELGHEDYAKKLGIACYETLIARLKALEKGGVISEQYEILIKSETIWQRILKHMSREVKVEVLSKTNDGKGIRIKFRKIYRKSDKTLRGYLEGKGVTD